MNDSLMPIIAIGAIVVIVVLVLVNKGYVKQAEKTNRPAVFISLAIVIAGGLIAFLGKK
ncbi:MAG: hypothetical protein ABI171_11925 [Collimonas sp.]|uniref:hypothetical protein n=1 Tax=Collimonas sp. TaxID=1963772 RepID=UPI003264458B